MKSLYILLVAIAVSATACKTKVGEPGPAGEAGLAQQGKVSGTLAYIDRQGNPVSVPFAYSYYESLTDNMFYYNENNSNYGLHCHRRDLKDYNNYVAFSYLEGGKANGQFMPPTSGTIEFSLLKVMGDELFEFKGGFDIASSTTNSSYTITNFVFDPTTGRANYDFVLTFDPQDISSETRYDASTPATLTGRIDVTLNRVSAPSQQQPPVTAQQPSME